MKRLIRASKYSDEASKLEKWIGIYGDILSDIVKADDDAQLSAALSKAGKWFSNIKDKKTAIKAIVDQIDYTTSEYLLSSNSSSSLPQVEDDIVSFLKQEGYDMTPVKNKDTGVDDAWILLPEGEAKHSDLIDAAKAVSYHFGIKPSGQVIGGSWTSYPFKMDGVSFDIGFKRDYDADPQGKAWSLMLVF